MVIVTEHSQERKTQEIVIISALWQNLKMRESYERTYCILIIFAIA